MLQQDLLKSAISRSGCQCECMQASCLAKLCANTHSCATGAHATGDCLGGESTPASTCSCHTTSRALLLGALRPAPGLAGAAAHATMAALRSQAATTPCGRACMRPAVTPAGFPWSQAGTRLCLKASSRGGPALLSFQALCQDRTDRACLQARQHIMEKRPFLGGSPSTAL